MYYYNIEIVFVTGLCKLSSPELKLLEGGKPLNIVQPLFQCVNIFIYIYIICFNLSVYTTVLVGT